MKFETLWVTPEAATHFYERPLAFGDDPKAGLFNVAEVARVGVIWVPVTPLSTLPVTWAMTCTDQYARVPVFGYKTLDHDPAKIVGMVFQLAYQALLSLPDGQNMKGFDICRLYLGKSIMDWGESFAFHLGLALIRSKT